MFGSNDTPKPTGPVFPIFLLPSLPIPFRRRKPSSSTIPLQPTPTTPSYSFSFRSSTGSGSGSASTPPSLSTSLASPVSTAPSSPTSPSYSTPRFTTALTAEPDDAADDFVFPAPSPPKTRLRRALPDTLRCGSCAADVAYGAQIVSKGFTGRHGRAYLVSPPPSPGLPATAPGSGEDLVNIRVGRPESRQLVTGAHVVADITCAVCAAKLGWKYVDAREPAQRYKVGKFILETARVVAFRAWDDAHPDIDGEIDGRGVDEDEVRFDSEDEDECEDIFAGTWDAEAVARRRRGRVAVARKKASGGL